VQIEAYTRGRQENSDLAVKGSSQRSGFNADSCS
jgi:hypothetical protein